MCGEGWDWCMGKGGVAEGRWSEQLLLLPVLSLPTDDIKLAMRPSPEQPQSLLPLTVKQTCILSLIFGIMVSGEVE